MATQGRADDTRRAILDAAADVFEKCGYGNAALSDVAARAGVTRGAFNYHFPTKESLAAALIAYADAALAGKEREAASESASPLENLIRSSFAMHSVIAHDAKVRIGSQLSPVMEQTDQPELQDYLQRWKSRWMTLIEEAIAEGDLNSDVDAFTLMYVLWCGMSGHIVMGPLLGMDPAEGLALIWRANLRGIVPAKSASYFCQVIDRVAAQSEKHR